MSDHKNLWETVHVIQDEDSSHVDYKLNGSEKIMFAEKVSYGNHDWRLIISLDKSIVFKKLYEAGNKLLIVVGILIMVSSIATIVILNVLYRPIIALKATVESLAGGDGDLTQRLKVNSDDDLGVIAKSINAFIEQLQTLMIQVESVAKELEHNAESLKTTSDENSLILSQHTQETEQIVAAVEEMSATANSVARNASDSSHATQEAAEIGDGSIGILEGAQRQVATLASDVDKTSESMQAMTNETSNISKILDVIGDIAEQTNLLALNAAIEAARAGEKGRGFAVVADEVRALASRTQASTVEIEDALKRLLNGNTTAMSLMKDTQAGSQKTLDNTEEVNSTLRELISRISSIKDLSFQIATAAEEQSSVTEEINQNMVAIHGIVNQLNDNGEIVVEQATGISEKNKELLAIVNKFKLK